MSGIYIGEHDFTNATVLGSVTVFSVLPASPSEGDLVILSGHATLDNGEYIYSGSAWIAITTY